MRAIAISFVDLPVKLWTISSKVRNALVHALHGNGGGSRATARKRKEKAKSATDLSSFDLSQLMQLFQAISKLLELLQGRDGGNLLQQFLKLGFPSDKKKDDKEGITKKKKKKHDGGGGKSLSKTTTKQVTLDKSKTPDKVQQSQGAPMVKRKPTLAGKRPSLKRPAVVATNPSRTTETAVVRVSIDAKYMSQSEWNHIRHKPRGSAELAVKKFAKHFGKCSV